MKISKLYIKIFLSFLVVLVLIEILIFGIFMHTAGRIFRGRMEDYTVGKIQLVKEVIRDRISDYPDLPLAENEPLKKFLKDLGDNFHAKIWITSSNNTIILKSFRGNLPRDVLKDFNNRFKSYSNFQLAHSFKSDFEWYGIIPLNFEQHDIAEFHVLFEDVGMQDHEKRFALWLLIIGGVIALLIIPISRFITKPLRQLKESAMQIAGGDLSHRAEIKSKDELGDLCRSFNYMTDKLEKMIRSGKELTANVSHELRSPLARIRVAEELIRSKMEKILTDEQDKEKYLGYMENIREDIDDLDQLIGKILDFSKLDLHNDVFNFETFYLDNLVNELIEKFRPIINKNKFNLKININQNCKVWADKPAITTALTNLLENGIKYTDENGGINMLLMREENSFVFKISNTSSTISQSDLHQIFEPFYRIHGNNQTGAGLGLSITKKIIEKHNGKIEASYSESEFGVTLTIPMHPIPERVQGFEGSRIRGKKPSISTNKSL